MGVNNRQNIAYCLNQPLSNIFSAPIVSNRAPTTADKAPIGQVWVNKSTNTPYMLTSIVANSANWLQLESGGGAGVFTSLVVTGPTTLTGTTLINTTGAAATTIGTGGTGAVNIGNATGNTAVTGALSTTTTLTGGTGVIATTGGVTASAGNIVATLGDITATAGSMSAGTTVTAGTGITSTTGNIVATAGAVSAGTTVTATNNVISTTGSFQASAAGQGVILGGGPFIVAGAGDPSGAVSAPHGSLYLNTTGSGTADRAFINNSVGTGTVWVAVTTAS